MQFAARKMFDTYLENDKILCSGRNLHLQWLLQGKLDWITTTTVSCICVVKATEHCKGVESTIINSYSSRTRRIWADIYNQRGRRLLSAHIPPVREE